MFVVLQAAFRLWWVWIGLSVLSAQFNYHREISLTCFCNYINFINKQINKYAIWLWLRVAWVQTLGRSVFVGVGSDRLAIQSRGEINVMLSAQHLLSCIGRHRGQNGCHPNGIDRAWWFIRRVGSVTTSSTNRIPSIWQTRELCIVESNIQSSLDRATHSTTAGFTRSLPDVRPNTQTQPPMFRGRAIFLS